MRWLGFIGLLLVGLTFASPMPVGAGWLWDIGNGFGFSALALMLYLYIDSGRGRRAKRHQALAWLAVGAGTVHAAYFVVLDSTVIEYLKPTMPLYMAIGIVAFVLLIVTAVTSIADVRKRLYANHGEFKNLHWWFSALLVGTTGYHVVGSAFYYSTRLQMLLVIVLLAGLALWPRSRLAVPMVAARAPANAVKWAVGVLVVLGIMLVLPRNL